MLKVSHQIINEKTVQVYSTLQCNLVFFMIAFEHTAQQCSENDLVTAESQLVYWFIFPHLYYNDEVLLARIEQFLRSLRDTFELGRDT